MTAIREKQLQKRKDETLDVALRLLLQRGYANLNMDELAVEAGISKPTLYQYFESKEALATQAVGRMFENMAALIPEPSDQSPLEQLEKFLRVMLKARSENRYLTAPGDMEMLRSIQHNDPNILVHLQAAKDKLDKIVRQGQALGEIDPALPSWVIVNAVFSLQRVIFNPFARSAPARTDDELAAAVDSIVRFFRKGVSVETPIPT